MPQCRDARLCFEVLSLQDLSNEHQSWPFDLQLLLLWRDCYQTVSLEKEAFYSRIMQPPQAGALAGDCCWHSSVQEGSAQEHSDGSALTHTLTLQQHLGPGCYGKHWLSGQRFFKWNINLAVNSPTATLHEHMQHAQPVLTGATSWGWSSASNFFSLVHDFYFSSNVPQGPKGSFIGVYFLWWVQKLPFHLCIERNIPYTASEAVGGLTSKRNYPRGHTAIISNCDFRRFWGLPSDRRSSERSFHICLLLQDLILPPLLLLWFSRGFTLQSWSHFVAGFLFYLVLACLESLLNSLDSFGPNPCCGTISEEGWGCVLLPLSSGSVQPWASTQSSSSTIFFFSHQRSFSWLS